MRVALAEVGKRGRMELRFGVKNGQTVLYDSYFEVPFKITRLLNSPGEPAHLILMHCTAGVFGGDNLECAIRVDSGANLRITQQSATKIHPSGGLPALQRTHVTVEAGGKLELYLEPLIPFPDSSLRQATDLDVAPGARLLYWESFMTGRLSRGESWQFRELSSETRLRSDGRLAYLDRFRLEGGREAAETGHYIGTGIYVGPGAETIASYLHDLLPAAGIDCPCADVALARTISAAGPDFHRSRDLFCGAAKLIPLL
jgi:urease accessory protein UreH